MISITALTHLIRSKFNNFYVKDIKILSSMNQYITCSINNEYIFNIILNPDSEINYQKESELLDFIRPHISTEIPSLSFFFASDDVVIKGYKKINGVPLNINIFRLMSPTDQDKLIKDIVNFLKELHSIPYKIEEINEKEKMLEKINYIKENIYEALGRDEQLYIDEFLERLNNVSELSSKTTLSHNSLRPSRFIINEDNKLVGVVGFEEIGASPLARDFALLLDDEEFGTRIITEYGLNLDKIKEYKDILDRYYPIEVIQYGLKHNRNDIVEEAKRQIVKDNVK